MNQFPVKPGTEASAVGKQINSFDQICFSLCITTVNYICSAAKVNGFPFIITETGNCKAVNLHELP